MTPNPWGGDAHPTGTAVADQSDTVPMTQVMALVECIIAGVRRQPRERFWIETDRVPHLVQVGHVMSDHMISQMTPAAQAAWRAIPPRVRGLDSATLVVDDASTDTLWATGGRILSPMPVQSHYTPAEPGDRPLRVLQITGYDPGSAVYRYHSAANTVPGIQSAFVRIGHSNPHCDLRQWDGVKDVRSVETLLYTADVVHCHMDYRALLDDLRMGIEPHQRAAITYHGSLPPGDPRPTFVDEDADRRMNSIRFGARPYHLRWGVEHWLPIPMPVRDYQALAANRPAHGAGPFRIAHSPTKREIKGTSDFLRVVSRLQAVGVSIEPVLIENMDHGDALAAKATCHAVFDSFWLGMQGSGLEGAAMGLAVIAGDPDAQADLLKLGIPVPWTIANDEAGLYSAICRLIADPAYYQQQAAMVHDYVCRFHDYPIVGAKYRDILLGAVRGAADR